MHAIVTANASTGLPGLASTYPIEPENTAAHAAETEIDIKFLVLSDDMVVNCESSSISLQSNKSGA